MKNIFYSFLTCGLIVFANISTAHAQQVNAKIQELYGANSEQMVASDPERAAFLNDLLDNRVKITELEISPNEKYPKLSEVALLNKYNPALTRDVTFDPTSFNPLKYNFIISSKLPVVYRVDNTNYLIVIQPQTIK